MVYSSQTDLTAESEEKLVELLEWKVGALTLNMYQEQVRARQTLMMMMMMITRRRQLAVAAWPFLPLRPVVCFASYAALASDLVMSSLINIHLRVYSLPDEAFCLVTIRKWALLFPSKTLGDASHGHHYANTHCIFRDWVAFVRGSTVFRCAVNNRQHTRLRPRQN